ncbi:MAG: DUF4159 domain-containing protein [Acidimicrobiia bacterium]|nr:DUF4159 domain-containing protein [Acidimicrobiia bacterium]
MSSAWPERRRRAWRSALVAALAMAASATSIGARDPRVEYDGRLAFTRIQYGAQGLTSGRFRREPTWAHDFPRADFHFLKILGELTYVKAVVDEGNVLRLDDQELGNFPVAYMSEPGFWQPSDSEVEGLRSYLQKGGFIIFDDFRGNHVDNLIDQMRRVMPGARFQKLDATHPIFHSFFEISTLDPRSGYYADAGDTEWLGIFEDNDPRKRLIAIANNNHDLGELWEFSDTGYVPVDLSNQAYQFGVNYVIYALTH